MLFIFDENFPHQFVQRFSILERANRRSPFHVDVVFSVEFMGGPKIDPITGEREHKVGFIYFRTPKKYVYWDYVKAFVNRWEEIKEEISNASHPFAFEISKQGHLKRLEF